MKVTIAIIPLLLSVMKAAQGTDYCNHKLCDRGKTHIACKNNGSFAERCSEGARLLTFDMSSQNQFVRAHNDVRQKWANGRGKVQAKACRMSTVWWNDDLAKMAEYNVKQCVMHYDQCHNTEKYLNSGQNLFYTESKGTPPQLGTIIKQAVDSWASEGNYVDDDILNEYPENYNGSTISHFTTLVRYDNIDVGCAVSTYINEDGFTCFLVACNYATTNVIGQPVYEKCSIAGENCETGGNHRYPALCSDDEYFDIYYGNHEIEYVDIY